MIRLRQTRAAALALLLSGVAACAKTEEPAAPPTVVVDYGIPLVFFDWDSAMLNERGRAVAAAFVGFSTRLNTARIEVRGYADRSGAQEYNQRLSVRRANNVAAELVRLGVDRRIIFIPAFGETRPMVPTRDGAREPQNRRVELVTR